MKKATITTLLLLSALLLSGCSDNNKTETTSSTNINVAEDTYETQAQDNTTEATETEQQNEQSSSNSNVPLIEFDPAYSVTVENNVSDNIKVAMKFEPMFVHDENKPEAAIVPFNKDVTYKDISSIANYELITTDKTFSIDFSGEYFISYDKENNKDINGQFDFKYEGLSLLYENYQTSDNGEIAFDPVFSVEAYNEKGLITSIEELNDEARIKAICANANNIYGKTSAQNSYIIPTITFTDENENEYTFCIGGTWSVDDELAKAGICKEKDVYYRIDSQNEFVVIKNTNYTVVFKRNLNGYIDSITLINN